MPVRNASRATADAHDGPEAARSGYDQIVQGEAGLMSLTGPDADNPQRVGVPIADLLAGMNGAQGVLAALFERTRTGRGKVVRTSLLSSVVGVHAFQGLSTMSRRTGTILRWPSSGPQLMTGHAERTRADKGCPPGKRTPHG